MSEEFKKRLAEANRAMLGKTNRAILFTSVNLDEYLDPDASEDERTQVPSLARLLPRVPDMSEEELAARVREDLTVTSFEEFLEKFQPGFYYRVRPPQPVEGGEGEEDGYDADTDGEAGGEGGEGDEATASDSGGEGDEEGGDGGGGNGHKGGLELEFALKGGEGWKKVAITSEHPYVLCLSNLIKTRVKKEETTFRVNVGDSLFAFKPRNQRALVRKLAENVQARSERLMLEAKRNANSPDARKALAAYSDAAGEFQEAVEDHIRVLPTVVYGLEETAKELKRMAPPGQAPDTNVYQIEFGANRRLIAAPKPPPALAGATARALAAAEAEKKALGAGEKKALGAGAESTELAKKESEVGGGSQAIAVRTIDQALDVLRAEAQRISTMDIAKVRKEEQFPAVVGKFMDQMISEGAIAPLMGSLVATVIQDASGLAKVKPKLEDVTYYHDVFLDMYSHAVDSFLQTVTPLFEAVMGIYLLFNEFPRDVRLSDEMKPQLILANGEMADLYMTRAAELEEFFQKLCSQAANQYRDAISFCLVPHVAEFRKKRPTVKKKKKVVDVTGGVLGQVQSAMDTPNDNDEGYGRVAFVDEMLTLFEWGYQYGFQVLFSPEDKVRSGRSKPDDLMAMRDAYAVPTVVDRDFANCAVMCVPDFIVMPPDGKLVTGRSMETNQEIGIDVPELTVRSCYVAAGRLMANDVPDFLRRKLQKSGKDPQQARPDLPGVGVNLGKWPMVGQTELPADHFHGDFTLRNLLDAEMPFLVFTHVNGRPPFLSVPRTMRRVQRSDGSNTYASLHLFRQYIHVRRLFTAANLLNLNQELPADDAEAAAELEDAFRWILDWSGWYKPDTLANSFPSRLKQGEEITFSRQGGNSFKIAIGFEEGVIADFGLSFGS